VKRFKDELKEYTYDTEAEKRCYPWHIKILGIIAAGLALTTFLFVILLMMKIVHDVKFIFIPFGITIVYSIIFKFIYDQRVPRCSTCGKKMQPMLIDKPKEEFTSLELSVALKNKDNDAVYFKRSEHSEKPVIYRVKKKIFVCTQCKSYITALKEVEQNVGFAHRLEDIKEKRMKRDRRYRERHRDDSQE